MSPDPRIARDPGSVDGRHFDVAIVGGGIYGALCAVESAQRGLGTLLVEAADFGAGTSFSSLRTIHGGLRYLQWLDFARARRSARQQCWWLEQFPDLVQSRACVMPLYGRWGRSRTAFHAAGVLARLAGMQRLASGGRAKGPLVRLLGADEVRRRWPGIRAAGLRGGAEWREGFMPESGRVIIECLRWAVAGGATMLNYAELVAARPEGQGRSRLTLRDRVAGADISVSASTVVNAAGDRVEEVARHLCGDERRLVTPTIAWNILLDAKLPEDTCLVLAAPKSRSQAYFMQPFHGRVLAGTGHAGLKDRQSDGMPPRESLERMCSEIDAAYPDARLGRAPVLRILAGMLPGVGSGEVRLAVRPRIHHDVATGGARLLHVVGVKLTEAPEVARRTLDGVTGTIARKLPGRPSPGSGWNALDPAHPPTRESLLALAARESVLYLDDLLERRTNAWCDAAASAKIADLMAGAFRSKA